jgi:hypothetical protein
MSHHVEMSSRVQPRVALNISKLERGQGVTFLVFTPPYHPTAVVSVRVSNSAAGPPKVQTHAHRFSHEFVRWGTSWEELSSTAKNTESRGLWTLTFTISWVTGGAARAPWAPVMMVACGRGMEHWKGTRHRSGLRRRDKDALEVLDSLMDLEQVTQESHVLFPFPKKYTYSNQYVTWSLTFESTWHWHRS